jgi:hypothetical protein
MTLPITTRRRFVVHAAVIVLVIVALRTPGGQSIVSGGLVEFADITERVVHFPCLLLDHTRCFSLDRFDPTCPQCM